MIKNEFSSRAAEVEVVESKRCVCNGKRRILGHINCKFLADMLQALFEHHDWQILRVKYTNYSILISLQWKYPELLIMSCKCGLLVLSDYWCACKQGQLVILISWYLWVISLLVCMQKCQLSLSKWYTAYRCAFIYWCAQYTWVCWQQDKLKSKRAFALMHTAVCISVLNSEESQHQEPVDDLFEWHPGLHLRIICLFGAFDCRLFCRWSAV